MCIKCSRERAPTCAKARKAGLGGGGGTWLLIYTGSSLGWWKSSKIDSGDGCRSLWKHEHFSWVNYMVCNLSFSKAVKKNTHTKQKNENQKIWWGRTCECWVTIALTKTQTLPLRRPEGGPAASQPPAPRQTCYICVVQHPRWLTCTLKGFSLGKSKVSSNR